MDNLFRSRFINFLIRYVLNKEGNWSKLLQDIISFEISSSKGLRNLAELFSFDGEVLLLHNR